MKKEMFQQREPGAIDREAAARTKLSQTITTQDKGRKPARIARTKGLGLKFSEEKMDQLARLSAATRWSQTVVIEVALDVFEKEWKAGRVK